MAGNGSEQLRLIGAALRANGNGALRLKTVRALRAGAAPLPPAVKTAALRQLPHSGGLNQQVASQKVTVSVSLSARSAGVRLKTSAPDTAQTDAGYVRHPVFAAPGRPRVWVRQEIPQATGWWSKTLAYKAPATVTPALMTVIREVAAELEV